LFIEGEIENRTDKILHLGFNFIYSKDKNVYNINYEFIKKNQPILTILLILTLLIFLLNFNSCSFFSNKTYEYIKCVLEEDTLKFEKIVKVKKNLGNITIFTEKMKIVVLILLSPFQILQDSIIYTYHTIITLT